MFRFFADRGFFLVRLTPSVLLRLSDCEEACQMFRATDVLLYLRGGRS